MPYHWLLLNVVSTPFKRITAMRKPAVTLVVLAMCLAVASSAPSLLSLAMAQGPAGDDFPIATASGDQTTPAVAYNSQASEFLVAWIDERNAGNLADIYGRRLASDGALLESELVIAGDSDDQRDPVIAARTGSSEYLVVWRDRRNVTETDLDIYGQIIGSGGSLRGGNIPIDRRPGRQRAPAIAHCSTSDSYLTIWDEDEDAVSPWRFFMFGQRVSSGGLVVGGTITTSADYPTPGFQQVDADLVYNPQQNEYLAIYRDGRNFNQGSGTNDDIYGQRLSCAGEALLETDLPITTQYSEAPGGNRQNYPALAYDSQRNQYLVVWQDERNDPDAGTPGDHRDIYGQVVSGGGSAIVTPVEINFPISTADGNQEQPDVAYSRQANAYLVVWADHRGSDADIFARLVSGSGTPWAEEIVISDAPGDQLMPAVAYDEATDHFLIVWQDHRNQSSSGADIYGRLYQAPDVHRLYLPWIVRNYSPDIWPPDAEERAQTWLRQQTNSFSNVTDIPGYGREGCSGEVARYKDSVVCYPAIIGNALVSFDYCNYGTPDQQAYLGRWGRGSLYDQAVGAIAWLMAGEPDEARRLLDYLSSYQNLAVPVSGADDGSFGFSFNTAGCPAYAPNNRDSFYDMDYLRSGAISWAGYAFLMYQRVTGDTRYLEVALRTADYLLTQQVTNPADPRFGLLRGGHGTYDTTDWHFTTGQIEWVSTEHNLDAFFFLRDLGTLTGDTRYTTAAQRIQDSLLSELWNDEKGRFGRGMDPAGQLDDVDALDSASWGAMFLLAVGEEEKAYRSLDFATRIYGNAADGLWGYKPYAGTADGFDWDGVDVVWSEGSLGVAMAYLKLGGEANRNQARNIIADMARLQNRDPAGGLLYAAYTGDDLVDFPRAPSVGGTGWLIMTLRAWADPSARDAFWGGLP